DLSLYPQNNAAVSPTHEPAAYSSQENPSTGTNVQDPLSNVQDPWMAHHQHNFNGSGSRESFDTLYPALTPGYGHSAGGVSQKHPPQNSFVDAANNHGFGTSDGVVPNQSSHQTYHNPLYGDYSYGANYNFFGEDATANDTGFDYHPGSSNSSGGQVVHDDFAGPLPNLTNNANHMGLNAYGNGTTDELAFLDPVLRNAGGSVNGLQQSNMSLMEYPEEIGDFDEDFFSTFMKEKSC
ncbi:MAG: hypothetical protein Q9218_007832, partial [Villophora microphyllina]